MAIASIAHWDWPDEWPNLIEILINYLHSDNKQLVYGKKNNV